MVLAPSTIGLAYVTAGTVIGPILGFNLFFVCIVSGQVAGSICGRCALYIGCSSKLGE